MNEQIEKICWELLENSIINYKKYNKDDIELKEVCGSGLSFSFIIEEKGYLGLHSMSDLSLRFVAPVSEDKIEVEVYIDDSEIADILEKLKEKEEKEEKEGGGK